MTSCLSTWFVFAAILALAIPRQSTDPGGIPLQWKKKELVIHVLSCPDTFSGVKRADVVAAAQMAATAWTGETALKITVQKSDLNPRQIQEDGRNTLSIRFYPPCRTALEYESRACNDPNRLGHTTVYPARQKPGEDFREIVEADIELNAEIFSKGSPAERLRLLHTMILHEMGHLLGLGHNCVVSEYDRDTPHQQQPFPICNARDKTMTSAAMFPFESEADMHMTAPSAEETALLVQIYGADKAHTTTMLTVSGSVALVLVLFCGFVLFRQNRRKSGPL